MLADAPCPKHMIFGPCQGVQDDGACELSDRACPFLTGRVGLPVPVFPRREPVPAVDSRSLRELHTGPIVLAELPSDSSDAEEHRKTVDTLRGTVHGVLLGDAPWARVQLPAVLRVQQVTASGLRAFVGLNCRDRNRVALESELLGIAEAGAAGVLCLTGDHPAIGGRPDAAAVFDLDSTRLASLAAGRGMTVLVAESPRALARDDLARLEHKAAAGAEAVIINHGDEADVRDFAVRAKQKLPELIRIASVPVVVSPAGQRRIEHYFPGAVRSEGVSATAGVQAAIDLARRLLGSGLFGGIDLSAAAGPGEQRAVSEAIAEVCAAVAA